MKKFLILIVLLLKISISANNNFSTPYVVVLSMDGFRWDYTDKCETPNLDYIEVNGVKSEIIPSFPSKTFPNHYTLATGMYPDNHGLVLNTHYNYSLNKWYKTSDRSSVEDGRFYGGEPIWNTAEKQGIKTGTLFWVGSEAPANGMQPTYWKKYQHNMPFESRIDTVISWLQKPIMQRPRLVMWYLHQPDSWGHKLGPENDKINPKIEYLDSLAGLFLTNIDHLSIADSINIIITSDHGMGQLDNKKVEILDNYIKKKWLEKYAGNNPVFMIEPKDGFNDSVYINLKKATHLKTWKKGEIPDYLHFGNHNNVMPIVVTADSSWSVEWRNNINKNTYLGGTHGYDPTNRDMHAIFYAIGPNFKNNYIHPSFANIHLYSLIAELLNIKPVDTDGNVESVENMLY